MKKKEFITSVLFFDKLSERKWGENDLSDVTWALCETSKKFKKLFLDFCFKTDTPEMEIFEREKPSHDSRPDFYGIDKEQKEWVLEVKIDDKKELHFSQYYKEFKNANFAFIANYDAKSLCDKNFNFSITTWKDFINHLSENIIDDSLIIGYIKYLKKLTGFLEVKDMDLKNVKSLPDFNSILENVIHELSKEKKLEFNNNKKSFSKDFFGRSVDYTVKKDKIINFWIGIHFCDSNSKISYFCLELDAGLINKNIQESASKVEYYLDLYDDIAHFYLKDDDHDILFSKSEIDKKKQIIYNFINLILEKI